MADSPSYLHSALQHGNLQRLTCIVESVETDLEESSIQFIYFLALSGHHNNTNIGNKKRWKLHSPIIATTKLTRYIAFKRK
jgi:hypothetical protein